MELVLNILNRILLKVNSNELMSASLRGKASVAYSKEGRHLLSTNWISNSSLAKTPIFP